MKNIKSLILFLIVTIGPFLSHGQKSETGFLFTELRIFTGTGSIIENGAVGVKNGVIDYVGTTLSAPKQNYTEVISRRGQHLYPGFIAMNTTIGLTEIDAVRATRDFRETGDMNPNVRAISAYNAESEIGETILANGILFA